MKKFNIIYLSFVLGLFFTACEKDLDLTPQDELSGEAVFSSELGFKTFATQFYTWLPRPADEDIQSDIAFRVGGNDISRGTLLAPQNDNFWDDRYKNIRACNLLIKNGEELKDEDLKKSIEPYLGEAYLFRAYSHYRLYRKFGGIPVITKPLTDDSEELYQGRNTATETINQVVSDLNQAIAYLPATVEGGEIGRAVKLVAQALKARVTLYEGTWRKFHGSGNANEMLEMAYTAADAVIKDGRYELFDRRDVLKEDNYRLYFNLDTDGRTNPANLTKADNKETIFASIYERDFRESSTYRPLTDHLQMVPTKALMDMFLCDNGLPITHPDANFEGRNQFTSEYQHRDPRMSTMMYIPGEKYWSIQFAPWYRDWTNPDKNGFIFMDGSNTLGNRTQTGYNGRKFTQEVEPPTGADYPVIRLAEVLLIYAEAKFEHDGSISDEDLNKSINKLRTRVGMRALTNGFVTSNGLNMREEIRRERTVELCFEGFRYDDIRRWKIAEEVLPQDILGIKWTGTEYESDKRFDEVSLRLKNGYILVEGNRKFDPEKHYLLPLPEYQIGLNDKLEQNPKW